MGSRIAAEALEAVLVSLGSMRASGLSPSNEVVAKEAVKATDLLWEALARDALGHLWPGGEMARRLRQALGDGDDDA